MAFINFCTRDLMIGVFFSSCSPFFFNGSNNNRTINYPFQGRTNKQSRIFSVWRGGFWIWIFSLCQHLQKATWSSCLFIEPFYSDPVMLMFGNERWSLKSVNTETWMCLDISYPISSVAHHQNTSMCLFKFQTQSLSGLGGNNFPFVVLQT